MGWLAETVGRFIPEQKTAIAAQVPLWQTNTPQYALYPQQNFLRYAREGYSSNELVFACVEELASSASEPHMVAYRGKGASAKKIDDHPILDLLEHPNPYMDRYTFMSTIIMMLSIAGNSYIEKVRSNGGKITELWHLRPDRIKILPDRINYIRAFQYTNGDITHDFDPFDIVHFKYKHPFDDYYGLPPLAACSRRVDTDNWAREFTRSFFTNAGVPAGLLSIQKEVNASEREMIKTRFRNETGGPSGWHGLLVIDQAHATYQPMGLPLGSRGLVLPELDEINEARIIMPFGVPLELVGARLGKLHATYANMREARQTFWDETLIPLYQYLAAVLNTWLVPEYDDIDRVEFDLTTVRALQQDEDVRHSRIRQDMQLGLITREEAREALGYEAEPGKDQTWARLKTVMVVPVDAPLLALPATTESSADVSDEQVDEGYRAGDQLRKTATIWAAETQMHAWRVESKTNLDAPTGLCICLPVPDSLADALALPGGEPPTQLHMTLAFCGPSTPELFDAATAAIRPIARAKPPLAGVLSGVGRFASPVPSEPDVIYLSVDVPGLESVRASVVNALRMAGVPVSGLHGFTPHITLAYIDPVLPSPLARMPATPVTFSEIGIWSGADRRTLTFSGIPHGNGRVRLPVVAGSQNGTV